MLGKRIIDDSKVINRMYLRPMHAHTDRKRNRNCTGELEREKFRKVNNYPTVCLQESLRPCYQSEKKEKKSHFEKVIIHFHPQSGIVLKFV